MEAASARGRRRGGRRQNRPPARGGRTRCARGRRRCGRSAAPPMPAGGGIPGRPAERRRRGRRLGNRPDDGDMAACGRAAASGNAMKSIAFQSTSIERVGRVEVVENAWQGSWRTLLNTSILGCEAGCTGRCEGCGWGSGEIRLGNRCFEVGGGPLLCSGRETEPVCVRGFS